MARHRWILLAWLVAGCGSSANGGSGGTGGNAGAEPEAEAGTGGAVVEAGAGGAPAEEAGTGGDPGTGGAPEAAACLTPGESCSGMADACCNGATCIYDVRTPTVGTCAANCLNGSQCASGCCKVLIEGKSAVCAPDTYCAPACIPSGHSCADNLDGCCADSTCVKNAAATNCAALCTSGTDCVSGCCAPLSNTAMRVCSDPIYCEPPACLTIGTDCFSNATGCCAGSACGTDTVGSHCAATCDAHQQCANNCCAPIGPQGTKVCAPSVDCL